MTDTLRQLDHILAVAIQIANDVIPFDRHIAYVRLHDSGGTAPPSEWHWHFTDRFSPADMGSKRHRRVAEEFETLYSENRNIVVSSQGEIESLTARIAIPGRALGCLSLGRSKKHGFVAGEMRLAEHLRTVIQAQLSGGRHARLLDRLNLQILHGRALIQTLEPDAILTEYLKKVENVCHYPDFGDPPPRDLPAIRTSGKRPTTNEKALRITACRSTIPGEWTTMLRQTPLYLLGNQKDSIAAAVWDTGETYWTNDYQNPRVVARRLFPDTCSHISAPILEMPISHTRARCIGILSIGTILPEAYDLPTASAVSLLAAHAGWLLSRHHTHAQNVRFATAAAQKFANYGELGGLFGQLKASLRRLGYTRGLISLVDPIARRVCGTESWGGKQMEAVCRGTNLSLDHQTVDCQVQAVLTREVQYIDDPPTDPRVDPSALKKGALSPFAIVPLIDEHGTVFRTVHIERDDAAPIGEIDRHLVGLLCNEVVRSHERERIARLDQAITESLLSDQKFDLRTQLESYAHLLTATAVFRWAHVYLREGGTLTPLCARSHLATRTSPASYTPELLHWVDRFRQADSSRRAKPVLIAPRSHRPGEKLIQQQVASDDILYVTTPLPPEHFPSDSQWVVLPVLINDRIVAEIILDHHGLHQSGFTFDEVRLLPRLTQLLTMGVGRVRWHTERSRLFRAGLFASLLAHHLLRICEPLVRRPGDPTRADAVVTALTQLNTLFRNHRDDRRRTVPIGQELNEVRLILEPACTSNHISLTFHLDGCGDTLEVPLPDRPVLLIVLTLVLNSHESLSRAATPGQIDITLSQSQEGWYLVTVTDDGPGLAPDKEERVRNTLSKPDDFLREEVVTSGIGGTGLAFAALLAREHKWQVSLERAITPTTFQLRIPAPSACDIRGNPMPAQEIRCDVPEWMLCDTDPGLYSDLKTALQAPHAWNPGRHFNETRLALKALEGFVGSETPDLLLTDRVGVSRDGGESFADTLRRRAPQTFILLHSRSVSDTDAAAMIARGEVDAFVPKPHFTQLVEFLISWNKRRNDPVVRQLRTYIESHTDPEEKYLFGPDGREYSLVDEYREVLKWSEFGKSAYECWKTTFERHSLLEAHTVAPTNE